MTPRARRVVTTTAGGESTGRYARFNLSPHVGDDPRAVAANRRRTTRQLGVPVVWLRPAGDASVATVDDSTDEPELTADALVTALPGVALAAPAADAVPVLLADPHAGVSAVLHADVPSVLAGAVPAVVAAMTTLGADPGAIEVFLGPALCGACHEVPADVRARVDAMLPGSATRARSGRPGVDLRAGLHHRLAALGIGKVGSDLRCTAEERDLYSERRDGVTGRHAGITWLDPG